MIEQPAQPRKSRFGWVLRVVLWNLVFFALYVLSIGPAYYLWYGSTYLRTSNMPAKIYAPLRWMCEKMPAFGDFIDNYITLWIWLR